MYRLLKNVANFMLKWNHFVWYVALLSALLILWSDFFGQDIRGIISWTPWFAISWSFICWLLWEVYTSKSKG